MVSGARSVAAAILFGAVGLVLDVRAQTLTPFVVITMKGPRAVIVEVASGTTKPCDSSEDRLLFKGTMQAGQSVTLQSPTSCVCWRQTYDNFPQGNWSAPEIICKTGTICRLRRCVPDPDPVIRLNLSSPEPGSP